MHRLRKSLTAGLASATFVAAAAFLPAHKSFAQG